MQNYELWIGRKVMKTSKNNCNSKPFKSGLKENTVKGIINHPILNVPSFTFLEDDSFVECNRCKLV